MEAEPRLVRGHIPWSGVAARLTSTRSMILSTTRPDGRPHAIPLWFVWDGAAGIYFITSRGTQKQRNLARQPWAVAHFGNGDDVLFAEGTVAGVADPAERDGVEALYRAKYVDPVSGRNASIYDNQRDGLYRLTMGRLVTWMYGTVGGWTEWRFSERRGGR